MSAEDTLYYVNDEVRSFLPSGWSLPEEDAGAWDEKARAWVIRVLDDVEFDWQVRVPAAEAERHGRLEALRQAMTRTYRDRLGKPTRGLGLAG